MQSRAAHRYPTPPGLQGDPPENATHDVPLQASSQSGSSGRHLHVTRRIIPFSIIVVWSRLRAALAQKNRAIIHKSASGELPIRHNKLGYFFMYHKLRAMANTKNQTTNTTYCFLSLYIHNNIDHTSTKGQKCLAIFFTMKLTGVAQ